MAREMKPSGIDWLPTIPSNWEIQRNKNLFKEVNERCIDGNQFTLLSISEYTGVSPRSAVIKDGEFETHAESLDGYKICKAGDIVMNIMLAWKRATATSRFTGIVSPAYCVFRSITNIDTQFYHYLFRTDVCADMFKRYSTGIIDSRLRLYPDVFLSLKSPVPPFEEQQRIVSFLNTECAKIDAVIKQTRASIEEYKILKQSIITEAVTKGIRSNRPMKDSGIEWIGEIPKEWEVVRLKWLCSKITDGSHFSPNSMPDGYPYITAKDIHGIGIDYNKANKISLEDFNILQKNGCQPHKGDVLIVKDGATTGRVGLMNDNTECVLLSSVAMLTPGKIVNSLFLMYLLKSDLLQKQILISMAGSAMPRITLSKLIEYYAIMCPMDEQTEIVEYLDSKCSDFDTLIEKKQQFLLELEIFKKSIIYEYVTGKKEVINVHNHSESPCVCRTDLQGK